MAQYKGLAHLDKERYCDKDGKDEHASQAIEVESPPSTLIHQGDGDEGHDDHDGADANGGVFGVGLRQAGRHEQVGRVVEDGVDP